MSTQLHVVLVSKDIPLEKAKQIAKHFIEGNKSFMKTNETHYIFRNHPKKHFEKNSFDTHDVDPNVRLIYGRHKTIQGGNFFDMIKEKIAKFLWNRSGLGVAANTMHSHFTKPSHSRPY
jgi:hypothetical protein